MALTPETILYGTRVGAADWQEEIIYGGPAGKATDESIERATDWATANGFDRLRVYQFDGVSMPDFAGGVR